MSITPELKAQLIKEYATHEGDTGSPEVQVAILSSGYLDPQQSLALLDALKGSKIYRSDQNSYMLYPYRGLTGFLEKNVLGNAVVEASPWINKELESGRRDFLQQDVDGRIHFNSRFSNGGELRSTLESCPEIRPEDAAALCSVYEELFRHRQFTGRSGTMYKYEGQGCI